ncbi:MAG TPA: hypothetical protein DEH78_20770, partial [Solibacterales bacterium]|nr:hypothetical protein [Bryobacterales bacterium]
VPVLDDWGAPGRVWRRRDDLHVIQVEPSPSRTALLADQWLPTRAGSEEAVARAIGGLETAAWAAERTGLPEGQIAEAARMFRERQPAIALGAAGEFLNGLVGSTGKPGGLYGAGPGLRRLQDVPDGSLRVVLVDAPIDYAELERKLAPGPVVISMSPLVDERMPWQVPLPVFGESVEDTPGSEPRLGFALAAAMMKPPEGVLAVDEFLAGLSRALGAPEPAPLEEARKARAAEL